MPKSKQAAAGGNGVEGDAARVGGISEKEFDLPQVDTSQMVRTTIVLSAEADMNLDLCRLKLGTTRNDLIKRAIDAFLIKEGFDPHRLPKNLEVSY